LVKTYFVVDINTFAFFFVCYIVIIIREIFFVEREGRAPTSHPPTTPSLKVST